MFLLGRLSTNRHAHAEFAVELGADDEDAIGPLGQALMESGIERVELVERWRANERRRCLAWERMSM